MPPSSIRQNRSGTTEKPILPTAWCETSETSTRASERTPAGCVGAKPNSARSFSVPNCHLHREHPFIISAKLNKYTYIAPVDSAYGAVPRRHTGTSVQHIG
jgi:hypothetical protein